MAFPPRHQRELDRGRGLARTLQPDEHQHGRRRRRVAETLCVASQKLLQLDVHRFDDLLGGGKPRRDLAAGKACAHPVDELLDHLEVDVRFEQREPDLAEASLQILWTQDAASRDLLQRGRETVAERFEHLAGPFDARDPSPQAVELALESRDRPPPSGGLGQEAKTPLVLLHRRRRTADDVVDRGARRALVIGDLRERPIAAQVEVNDLSLVVCEQRSVALVEGQGAPTRL